MSEERILYSSQLHAVHNKHNCMCVQQSSCNRAFDAGSSGSKEQNFGKPAAISYLYPEPTASDTLHCLTTTILDN